MLYPLSGIKIELAGSTSPSRLQSCLMLFIRTNRPETGLEPATRFRRSSVELLRHVMP